MKLYKLTDKKGKTRNNTQWGEGVTHKIKHKKRTNTMCSSGVLHAYKNLNLALLLNPIHADFQPLLAWEAEGDVVVEDWDKIACHELTTTTQIDVPKWYKDRDSRKAVQIQFAKLCADRAAKYAVDAKYAAAAKYLGDAKYAYDVQVFPFARTTAAGATKYTTGVSLADVATKYATAIAKYTADVEAAHAKYVAVVKKTAAIAKDAAGAAKHAARLDSVAYYAPYAAAGYVYDAAKYVYNARISVSAISTIAANDDELAKMADQAVQSVEAKSDSE